MSLSREDVQHVANLARLGMDDAEIANMQEQLSSILGHIDVLSELDTNAISPTAQVIALSNVFRADEPGASFTQEQALQNAPASHNGFFAVAAVLGGDEGGSA